MLRFLCLLPLLFAASLAAQALPDPNGSEGWKTVASKADVLALPEDTLHVHAYKLDDAGLEALKRLKALQSLTLDGTYTDAGIKHLGELKTLRDLQLDCARLGDAAMAPIGKLADLEYLGFERCTRLSDKGLRELSGLRKVTWLIFHGDNWDESGRSTNTAITDTGLRSLSGMTALRRLDLGSLQNAGDGALADWGPRLKDLTDLTLAYCGNLTEAAFRGLARCASLKSITLIGQKCPGEAAFKQIAGLKALAELTLTLCDGMDDLCLGALGKSKSLKSLTFSGMPGFGDAGLTELAKSKTLRALSLTQMQSAGGPDDWPEDGELPGEVPPAKPAKKEQPKAKASDAGIKALGKCESLRELTLVSLANVGDATLLAFLDLPLETLAIRDCVNVTDKGMQVIGKMKTLVSLTLSALSFGPPGMVMGDDKPQMKVTNEGLRQLAGLENLALLDLSGMPITDTGLTHLHGMAGLRRLIVQQCPGITDEGEAGLKTALPQVKVEREQEEGPPED
ncbi:MAG: hypothetical protein IPP14_06555 [Planctomycetes bacterium]|nr:hypothetical protein [Planctomycetota bacterium]